MTAHSRWLDIIYTMVSCSRCPLYPLSRLAFTGTRPLSVVKSLLLSLLITIGKGVFAVRQL
jgi:hypothetical protein